MREIITIERLTTGLDEFGGATHGWELVASLRAELRARDRVAKNEVGGVEDLERLTFKTRALMLVRLSDRIQWRGQPYQVRQVTGDFAGSDGLEITCEGAAA